jgi:hypothetical protein
VNVVGWVARTVAGVAHEVVAEYRKLDAPPPAVPAGPVSPPMSDDQLGRAAIVAAFVLWAAALVFTCLLWSGTITFT